MKAEPPTTPHHLICPNATVGEKQSFWNPAIGSDPVLPAPVVVLILVPLVSAELPDSSQLQSHPELLSLQPHPPAFVL